MGVGMAYLVLDTTIAALLTMKSLNQREPFHKRSLSNAGAAVSELQLPAEHIDTSRRKGKLSAVRPDRLLKRLYRSGLYPWNPLGCIAGTQARGDCQEYQYCDWPGVGCDAWDNFLLDTLIHALYDLVTMTSFERCFQTAY